MSFKAVQSQIAEKEGVSEERAGAILAASTRRAGAAARKKNPALNNVLPKKKRKAVTHADEPMEKSAADLLAELRSPSGMSKSHVKEFKRRNPKTGAMDVVHAHDTKVSRQSLIDAIIQHHDNDKAGGDAGKASEAQKVLDAHGVTSGWNTGAGRDYKTANGQHIVSASRSEKASGMRNYIGGKISENRHAQILAQHEKKQGKAAPKKTVEEMKADLHAQAKKQGHTVIEASTGKATKVTKYDAPDHGQHHERMAAAPKAQADKKDGAVTHYGDWSGHLASHDAKTGKRIASPAWALQHATPAWQKTQADKLKPGHAAEEAINLHAKAHAAALSVGEDPMTSRGVAAADKKLKAAGVTRSRGDSKDKPAAPAPAAAPKKTAAQSAGERTAAKVKGGAHANYDPSKDAELLRHAKAGRLSSFDDLKSAKTFMNGRKKQGGKPSLHQVGQGYIVATHPKATEHMNSIGFAAGEKTRKTTAGSKEQLAARTERMAGGKTTAGSKEQIAARTERMAGGKTTAGSKEQIAARAERMAAPTKATQAASIAKPSAGGKATVKVAVPKGKPKADPMAAVQAHHKAMDATRQGKGNIEHMIAAERGLKEHGIKHEVRGTMAHYTQKGKHLGALPLSQNNRDKKAAALAEHNAPSKNPMHEQRMDAIAKHKAAMGNPKASWAESQEAARGLDRHRVSVRYDGGTGKNLYHGPDGAKLDEHKVVHSDAEIAAAKETPKAKEPMATYTPKAKPTGPMSQVQPARPVSAPARSFSEKEKIDATKAHHNAGIEHEQNQKARPNSEATMKSGQRLAAAGKKLGEMGVEHAASKDGKSANYRDSAGILVKQHQLGKLAKGMAEAVDFSTTGSAAEAIAFMTKQLNLTRNGLAVANDIREAEHGIGLIGLTVETYGPNAIYRDAEGQTVCVQPLGALRMEKSVGERAPTAAAGDTHQGGQAKQDGKAPPAKADAMGEDASHIGEAIDNYHAELNKVRMGAGDVGALQGVHTALKKLGVSVSLEARHAIYTSRAGVAKRPLGELGLEMRRRMAKERMGFNQSVAMRR